jgi:hypothetical protein
MNNQNEKPPILTSTYGTNAHQRPQRLALEPERCRKSEKLPTPSRESATIIPQTDNPMPLQKAFDKINTAADRHYGFLASCSCQGDSCSCKDLGDGSHLFHIQSQTKETEMPNVIEKMTAAQRAELAAKIEASAEHMTDAERRDLIATLSAALSDDVKAKAAADRKAQVLANIQATATDVVGTGKREFNYMETRLRNKGVRVPLAELVWKTEQEIDAIFAASNLNPNDRVATKRFMGRMINGTV